VVHVPHHRLASFPWIKVIPSWCLPSVRQRPAGFLAIGTPAEENAFATTSFKAWNRDALSRCMFADKTECRGHRLALRIDIFLARTRTKSTTQNTPKHAISSQNSFFFWGRGISSGKGIPTPHPSSHHAFWIHPASPRIPARFQPLQCYSQDGQNIVICHLRFSVFAKES